MLLILAEDVDFFFFKQKTAYEMRISDWSSDVCSSDLDGCDQARGDLVGGAQAVDRYEQVALLVPLDQRRRLTLVEVEALADRFGGVVGSLHDLAAAVVAHPAVLGGHVNGVVCTAVGADPAGGEALEHDVGGEIGRAHACTHVNNAHL